MAKFQYVGDDARVYPDLSLDVAPGDVVELKQAPADGRWQAHDGKKKSGPDTVDPAEEA